MSPSLTAKILKAIREWKPTLLCYQAGRFPPGRTRALSVPNALPAHAEFLALSDGPACGCVSFFSGDDLRKFQVMAGDMPGGPEAWICLASVVDEPLFVNRHTGEVARRKLEDGSIHSYGEFEDFLERWVFGTSYEWIVTGQPKKDEWYEYLEQLGILSRPTGMGEV